MLKTSDSGRWQKPQGLNTQRTHSHPSLEETLVFIPGPSCLGRKAAGCKDGDFSQAGVLCTLGEVLSVPEPVTSSIKLRLLELLALCTYKRLSGLSRGTKEGKIHFGRNGLFAAAFSPEQKFSFRG